MRQTDEQHGEVAGSLKRMPVLWLAGAFIVLVCVSIVSIDLWQLEESREHELTNADVAATNLSKSLAQQAEDTFDEADIALEGVIDRLTFDGTAPRELEHLRAYMKHSLITVDQLQGLFVYDKDGNWTVTSFDVIPVNANNADRAYFIYHKSHTDLGPHISPAIRSRTTGDWVIPFSRRLNDAQGNFNGVVLGTIQLSYFDTFFDRFDIDSEGAIFLSLADGTVLARRPKLEGLTGSSLAKGKLFTDYLKQHTEGTAMIVSVIDGVRRLVGYKQLDSYPLVVAAAISERSILEQWRQNAWRSASVIGVVIIALVMFGVMLFQQIRFGLNTEARLRLARNSLEKLAMQDSLTGLANRRHFQEMLNIEFDPQHRAMAPFSLIMIDIDFFKSYNDAYGHVAGDKCIAEVADCVRTSLMRPGDLAVRYGGEEMAVFLPFGDARGGLVLAERIRLAVLARQLEHAGNPEGVVSVSLGVYTCLRSECPSMEAFIERADMALYDAKHAGRNRTAIYSPA